MIVDMDYDEGEWFRWGDGFWSTPFIWSKLHNFGGTDGLRGNLTRAAELPAVALRRSATIVGTGFTSEGIDQNPAYYDLILDSHFRSLPYDPTEYVVARALRRYNVVGALKDAARASAAVHATTMAWQLLAASVYSQDVSVQDYTGVTHLPGKSTWSFAADRYTPSAKMCQLFRAWGALIDTAGLLTADSRLLDEPLSYDLVDVGREVLAQLATPLSMNLSDALYATPHADPTAVGVSGSAYLAVLADLDTLLATDQAFLLGSWLQMARGVGERNGTDCTGPMAPTVPPEVVGCAHFFEWNARCQLTSWNPVPKGAHVLPKGPVDYASKHWNGLVHGYYRERAAKLIAKAKALGRAGRRLDAAADGAVRAQHAFAFQVATTAYLTRPQGDAVEVSRALHAKYSSQFAAC